MLSKAERDELREYYKDVYSINYFNPQKQLLPLLDHIDDLETQLAELENWKSLKLGDELSRGESKQNHEIRTLHAQLAQKDERITNAIAKAELGAKTCRDEHPKIAEGFDVIAQYLAADAEEGDEK